MSPKRLTRLETATATSSAPTYVHRSNGRAKGQHNFTYGPPDHRVVALPPTHAEAMYPGSRSQLGNPVFEIEP